MAYTPKVVKGPKKAESRSVALFASDWDKQKFSFYADFVVSQDRFFLLAEYANHTLSTARK